MLHISILYLASRDVQSRNFVGPNPILIRNHYSCIQIQALLCYKKWNPGPNPDPKKIILKNKKDDTTAI